MCWFCHIFSLWPFFGSFLPSHVTTWRFYSKSAFLFKHSRIWSLVAQVVRRVFSLGGYEKFCSVCFSFLFECRRCPSARLQSSERSLRAQRSYVESGKWCWFGFEWYLLTFLIFIVTSFQWVNGRAGYGSVLSNLFDAKDGTWNGQRGMDLGCNQSNRY